MGVSALCWCLYTDTSILTTTSVESKLAIVMIKLGRVSYYHEWSPFLEQVT